MKFIKKLASDMKTNWDNLNQQQKFATFDLMWEGNQLPNNRLINKVKGRLPGIHYRAIYLLIEKVILLDNEEDKKKLTKELLDFYSRPITPEQEKYYPEFREQIPFKLYPVSPEWLNKVILPDLKQCEEIQKKRLMKRYGLIVPD
jgi:hypothetical protein